MARYQVETRRPGEDWVVHPVNHLSFTKACTTMAKCIEADADVAESKIVQADLDDISCMPEDWDVFEQASELEAHGFCYRIVKENK